MDDREITHDANENVMRLEVGYAGVSGDLGQKSLPVDQRTVRIAVPEILRKVAFEPGDVALFDGPHIFEIQTRQGFEVAVGLDRDLGCRALHDGLRWKGTAS